MKKYFTSTKHKKRNERRSNRHFKRRLISNKKRKDKKYRGQGKSKEEKGEDAVLSNYTKITAPKHFSFVEKPDETIKFINKVERLYLNRSSVFINLKDITYLDYSAVTILVSVMFSFKTRNIKFNGNFPKNNNWATLLINSDFFKYLNKPIGNKIEYALGKENQIFTRANKEVNSELGYVVMAEATTTI